ncbi:hypothetical protein, partial [Klebsiella pneumoniae]|uniref:hypothetical protein n=1 Tax=Klebsiella pneumoniae TaxID=573 RepID=UPI0027319F33
HQERNDEVEHMITLGGDNAHADSGVGPEETTDPNEPSFSQDLRDPNFVAVFHTLGKNLDFDGGNEFR